MRNPDAIVAFVRGRTVTRRDLTHDNPDTMRREYYDIEGEKVTSWATASAIEQQRVRDDRIEPWGTYSRERTKAEPT